jgi:hypothetical protein
MFSKEHSCYATSGKYCACIEFHLSEHKSPCLPFQPVDRIHPGTKPGRGGRQRHPAAKTGPVFSTADVEVLGWRLGSLADKLQENNLAAVRILPKRYAELERNQPYVAFIGIAPLPRDDAISLEKAGINRKSKACICLTNSLQRQPAATAAPSWLASPGAGARPGPA